MRESSVGKDISHPMNGPAGYIHRAVEDGRRGREEAGEVEYCLSKMAERL